MMTDHHVIAICLSVCYIAPWNLTSKTRVVNKILKNFKKVTAEHETKHRVLPSLGPTQLYRLHTHEAILDGRLLF